MRFALVTLLALVRIASDRRVFRDPLTAADAAHIVEQWLDCPSVRLLHPGPRTWRILSELCNRGQVNGPMVMDAHLAALAIEHGTEIATTDRDFARFPGLRTVNPVETD